MEEEPWPLFSWDTGREARSGSGAGPPSGGGWALPSPNPPPPPRSPRTVPAQEAHCQVHMDTQFSKLGIPANIPLTPPPPGSNRQSCWGTADAQAGGRDAQVSGRTVGTTAEVPLAEPESKTGSLGLTGLGAAGVTQPALAFQSQAPEFYFLHSAFCM